MELISRKELLEKIENKEIVRLDKNRLCDIDEVLSVVRYGTSAVDSVPERCGKWVSYGKDGEYECSECGFPASRDAYGYHRETSPFCRFCGAKMDEVSK